MKTNNNNDNLETPFVFWGDNEDSQQKALNASAGSLEEYTGIHHANAISGRLSTRQDFSNLLPNISSRPGLTKSDYDYYRPQEAVPNQIYAILNRAELIYQRVGLVKNVIDLMGDFAAQGITVSHPNKRIERFYRNWFKKVNGKDRSERFLNNLYRVGNVVITRRTAKLSTGSVKDMYKASAADFTDKDIRMEITNFGSKEITWRYTFVDPTYIEIAAGPLASFVGGKKIYGLKLPAHLRKIINSPKNDAEKFMVSKLPPEVIEAAKTKKPYFLDPDKIIVNHYKKDDWQTWAFPMIYSIMDDITVLEKLKLADMAALDGAISNTRIFKLGNLDHKIAPTKAAAAKLASILQNNVGGGTMDIVWGPDIELIESKTNVHQFLGEAKYAPHLNSIYAGLGIPPTLTGTFGAAGTTNNFISLKTLTQRLQYGRRVLMSFWQQEIELVQKAMGFRIAAKIEFDRMDLSNEEAEKALLVQLSDRNIVSDELVQRVFGFDPDTEKNRLNRENRDRSGERMIPKAGPWHDPQFNNGLRKIALQTGLAAPSQVGLKLDPKKSGEKTIVEMKNESSKPVIPGDIPAGQPQQGRPRNSKDQEERKQRTFKPQTGASLQLWGVEAQEKIAQLLNPYLLEFYGKKNMRSLSSSEYLEAENTKTKIFLSLEPFDSIYEEMVLAKLNTIDSIDNKQKYNQFTCFNKNIQEEINRQLTAEETKFTKSYFYEHTV